MPRSTRRILAYDALRVFAILTVVAIHTLMPYRGTLPAGAAVRVLDDVLHYAVPLFVFISGALVWRSPLPPGLVAYRKFIAKRARVIGLPYLAWAGLFLGIYVFRAIDTLAALAHAPGLLLTGHVWYHLYFIPMLLTFYALTPVAAHIAKRSPELLVLLAYAVRLLAGAAIAEAARSLFGDLGWSYATHVITHLPHMALGAWFALRFAQLPSPVRRAWPALLIAGLGIQTAVAAGWISPSEMTVVARRLTYAVPMAATVLGFALGAFALEPWLERYPTTVVRLGALSFGVYFVHPLFLLAVDGVVASCSAEGLWMRAWFPVAVFSAVSVASFATSAMLGRYGATSWLIGNPKPALKAVAN